MTPTVAPSRSLATIKLNQLTTLEDVKSIADVFMKSGLFKDTTDTAQAMTKIMAGRELGLQPFAAMNSLYITRGRVGMAGSLMARMIKGSGKYDYTILEKTERVCRIEFFEYRNGERVSLGIEEFSIDDAKRAGIAGGDNWTKWPKNMLFNRAISNGYRTYCPDIFSIGSVYTPEELDGPVSPDDVIDVTPSEPVTVTGSDLPGAIVAEIVDLTQEPWRDERLSVADARTMLYQFARDVWGYVDDVQIRETVVAHPKWDKRSLQTLDDVNFVAQLLRPAAPPSEPE